MSQSTTRRKLQKQRKKQRENAMRLPLHNGEGETPHKRFQLKNQVVDADELSRLKELARATFRNLAHSSDYATDNAFETSMDVFLLNLLKEKSDPNPTTSQTPETPTEVDEAIDLNEIFVDDIKEENVPVEEASLIPADNTKPAPNFVDVLQGLAKHFLSHTSTTNKLEDILMEMEEAYWYYIDIYRTVWPELPSLSFEQFAQKMLQNVSFLAAYHFAVINSTEYSLVLENFKEYKAQLEVCGAILLNPTLEKVLLVNGWHGNSWTFPSGKIKRGEDPATCAIREVKEETGFDIAKLIQPQDFLRVQSGPRVRTMFIIQNVPLNYPFKPETRKEIKQVGWHLIEDLPQTFADPSKFKKSYHQIIVFVPELKNWLAQKRMQILQSGNYNPAIVKEPI